MASPTEQLQALAKQLNDQYQVDPAIFASAIAYLKNNVDSAQQQQVVDQIKRSTQISASANLLGGDTTALAHYWLTQVQSAASTLTQQAQQTAAAAVNTAATTPGAPAVSGTPLYGSKGLDGYSGASQAYTGATDPASLAALAGQDAATFEKNYADYLAHIQEVRTRLSISGRRADIAPQTMAQFAQITAQALQGKWQPVLDALDVQWYNKFGQRMPGELRQQVLQQIQGLDLEQQNGILAMEYNYTTQVAQAAKNPSTMQSVINTNVQSLLATLPLSIYDQTGNFAATGSTTGNYASENFASLSGAGEVASVGKARQQSYIDWMTQHGIPVDQATIDKLMKMPNSSSQTNPEPGTDFAYLLAFPSDIKGMTWQQKDISYSNMYGLWEQYFGRPPTQPELQWGIGKTPNELQDFVDNSKSKVDGLTIGQYNDYLNFIKNIGTSGSTTHAFSMGIDDSLMQSLHAHLTASATGQAGPPPAGAPVAADPASTVAGGTPTPASPYPAAPQPTTQGGAQ